MTVAKQIQRVPSAFLTVVHLSVHDAALASSTLICFGSASYSRAILFVHHVHVVPTLAYVSRYSYHGTCTLGLKRIVRIFANNRILLNRTNIFRGSNSRWQRLSHFSAISTETLHSRTLPRARWPPDRDRRND